MTPEQAQDIADRTLAAIDGRYDAYRVPNADRERVQSDLAGLLDCHEVGMMRDPWVVRQANRYATGLLRTARLYGVEP